MSRKKTEVFEVDAQEIESIIGRAKESLGDRDAEVIQRVFDSYEYVASLIQSKNMTIRKLQDMTFGARTEKTAAVTGQTPESPGDETPQPTAAEHEVHEGESSTLVDDEVEGDSANEVAENPECWMPWNYRAAVDSIQAAA